MPRGKQNEEEEDESAIILRHFDQSLVKPNSVITIIGKETNVKALYKDYGKYFDTMTQFKSIMNTLLPNQSLVIDETCPKNKITDILYIYGS
jgi:hypothetical protein